MKCDLVLAGCGVRGAAYAGAIEELDHLLDDGLEPQRIAGTSAGAIVGLLLAAGGRPRDLTDLLFSTDFNTFRDARFLRRSWDFNVHGGLYQGEALEKWLAKTIGGVTLGELRIPFSAVCFDIRNYETVVLSSASHPDMPAAKAARISASIPLFFRSVHLSDGPVVRELVDGGTFENFPVEIFDAPAGRQPRWPTIGLMIEDDDEPYRNIPCVPRGPEIALKLYAAVRAAYAKQLSRHNLYRTVTIPDIGISSIDFGLSDVKKRKLRNVGAMAAASFVARWKSNGGFEGYKNTYR